MNKVFDIKNQNIVIDSLFYTHLINLNSKRLIHQYNILEETGVLDNFRICLNQKHGYFKGSSYSDAKLYSWIEACSYYLSKTKTNQSLNDEHTNQLQEKLYYAINLVAEAQKENGYLYTFYQITNATSRAFKYLTCEKELFCMGHLIQAAIATFYTISNQDMVKVAKKAACLIGEQIKKNPKFFSGYPKIEYAFIQLYDATKNSEYLNYATTMIYQRGYEKRKQAFSFSEYYRTLFFTLHHQIKNNPKPKGNKKKSPYYYQSSRSSKYEELFNPPIKHHLQSRMARRSTHFNIGTFNKSPLYPTGDVSIFLNLKTAQIALINRLENTKEDFEYKNIILEQKKKILDEIDFLLRYHLYPNAMLGEYPAIKALLPHNAANAKTIYGESTYSADLVGLLWELFLLTREAHYIEIIEWIFVNSLPASIGPNDYHHYFYRQPLRWSSKTGNNNWYKNHTIASKINSEIAKLNNYIYFEEENQLYLLQLFSNTIKMEHTATQIKVTSELPYNNHLLIQVEKPQNSKYQLAIRIPAWADGYILHINNKKVDQPEILMPFVSGQWEPTFYNASFLYIDLNDKSTTIKIEFITSVRTIDEKKDLDYTTNEESIETTNRKAFYKNCILYYYESALNEGVDFDKITIDLSKPITTKKIDTIEHLVATTTANESVILAPYMYQGKYLLSQKEIYIPTTGGIGDWSPIKL